METDYVGHKFTDNLTFKKTTVSADQETTYFLIEPPPEFNYLYKIHGHLTYANSWRSNNLITHLLGNINVQFKSSYGADQIVNIQLPEYVLSNYINVDGKARVSLINGPMVLYDEEEQYKAVILVKGLIKKRVMLSSTWVANTNPKSDILQGLIYKAKSGKKVGPKSMSKTAGAGKEAFLDIKQLQDVEMELATIRGTSIDSPIIAEINSKWT